MGLTIHYDLHAEGIKTASAAAKVIRQLQRQAKSLPVESVSKVLTWDHRKDDPELARWYPYVLCYDRTPEGGRLLSAAPLELTMFVLRQAGSESACFGLARYEEIGEDMLDASIRRPMNLVGYHWHAFCKTQYASATQHGGWENFFAIHDGICRVLDAAIGMGLKAEVHDESGYWAKRDAAALRQEIDRWNGLVAAMAGKFKDLMGERAAVGLAAPILEDPAFEHMEAQGQEALRGPMEVREIRPRKRRK